MLSILAAPPAAGKEKIQVQLGLKWLTRVAEIGLKCER
jgi:hypothetical protein